MPRLWTAVAAALLLCGGALCAQGGPSALTAAPGLAQARKWVELQRVAEPVLRAEPKNAAAHYWLGRARAGQDDMDGARAELARAVELSPNTAEYHLALGEAYGEAAMHASVFSRLSLARKCKAEFERAVALNPRSVDARMALISYNLQAPGIAGGSKDRALAEADTLRRMEPYRGTFARQRVLRALGKPEAAISDLQALAAAYPDSAAPVTQLAVLYGDRKAYDAAFAAIEAFLKRHPRDRGALYALGRNAAVSGQRLDDGEAALRQYLAGEPLPGLSPGAAYWRLGMIQQGRGRTEDARREYETAVRLDPKDPGMRKSLDALKH